MIPDRFEANLSRVHCFSTGRMSGNPGIIIAVLLTLAGIIALTGCVSLSGYHPAANNYLALQDENKKAVEQIPVIQDDKSQLSDGPISPAVSDLQQQTNPANPVQAIGTDEAGSEAKTYGRAYAGVSPDVRIDVSGRTPNLVDNANAHDPSWAELKSFLERDPTDQEIYNALTHACGVFAEELQNNAEAKGIRAAYVDIGFAGQSDHHAINAFRTTDYGLVYIDDTGPGYQVAMPGRDAPASYDKICFVHEGEQYRCLGIGGVSPSCGSGCYASSSQQLTRYNSEAGSYNSQLQAYDLDVSRFNQEVSTHTYTIGTPEWDQINARETDLRQRGEALTRTKDQLLEMKKALVDVFDPLGTVGTVEVYW